VNTYGMPATINIELTNRCNKNCWMCGRRKQEQDPSLPKMSPAHMDYELLRKIAGEIPPGCTIQFHNNGEPLLYPRLKDALKLFPYNLRCLDTNGKLLVERSDCIIDNLHSVTVSTFQDDPEAVQQLEILREFLALKGDRPPFVVIRCLGDVSLRYAYQEIGCLIANRVLHSPMGSFNYSSKPVVPETGMCLEMLNHPAINVFGEMSICVRFDPGRLGVIGDLKSQTFSEIWNGEKRARLVETHIRGFRACTPLCSTCEYWGIPRG